MRIKTKAGMIAGNLGGASVGVKTALEAGLQVGMMRTPHADIGGWGVKWEVRHA